MRRGEVIPEVITDHASAGIFPDEGVSQDLGELAGSEWGVRFVTAKSSDTLLKQAERERKRHRSYFKITRYFSFLQTREWTNKAANIV